MKEYGHRQAEVRMQDINAYAAGQKKSLVSKIAWHARTKPEKTAFTFLANGHLEEGSLTFRELMESVLGVASELRSMGAHGQRALLLYPQGIDFIIAFLGCLAAGVIAIPAPPPEAGRLKRTLPRLRAIANDAGASFILSTENILQVLQQSDATEKNLNHLTGIDTSKLGKIAFDAASEPNLDCSDIAYLQYTSGSTSAPKGVKVGNAGLFSHLSRIQRSGGYDENSISVTWMPYFHDYGLVEGILMPLFNGTTCYLMSPFAFLKRPNFWLAAITRYKATHSQAPTFAYRHCVERVQQENLQGLDLSSWKSAAIAAEPVHPNIMRDFYRKFEGSGFRWESFSPAYGLAENVLVASMTSVPAAPTIRTFHREALSNNEVIELVDNDGTGAELVGCGQPLADTPIAIIDPSSGERCAANRVGEIWIKLQDEQGGYWRRDDLTEDYFNARIKDEENEGFYLRTGDFGFVKDDQLFITGRLKDLIILNGVNHWPQDIEWTIENSHGEILTNNCCAAFSVTEDGIERLVVALEVNRNYTDYQEVYDRAVQSATEGHEVALHRLLIVKVGGVPKTSSGKVQRQACKSAFLDGTLQVLWSKAKHHESDVRDASPSHDKDQDPRLLDHEAIEAWLLDEVSSLAGLERAEIDPNASLTTFGLDSRDMLTLSLYIEERVGIELPLAELVRDGRTIRQLANGLQSKDWLPDGKSLVAIQTAGSLPPLFFVHPAGGNVVGYSTLAQKIGTDRPFYGLQSQGLVEWQMPLTSVEEMASLYLDEMKTIQADGPYHIGGMCLGGMIAYEMAQQLQARGDEVAFLGLVDPRNPPALLDAMTKPALRRNIIDQDRFEQHAQRLGKLKAEAKGKPPISIPKNLFPNDPVTQRLVKSNLKARDSYMPTVYKGDAHFFWANKTPGDLGFYHDPRVCWSYLIQGDLVIHDLETGHFELLEEPWVSNLAQEIQRCL